MADIDHCQFVSCGGVTLTARFVYGFVFTAVYCVASARTSCPDNSSLSQVMIHYSSLTRLSAEC